MTRFLFPLRRQFDLPFVDVYRVKEFSYRPLNQEQTSEAHPQVFPLNDNNNRSHESRNNNKNKTASNNNGVWNCDGEVIDSSAIRVKSVSLTCSSSTYNCFAWRLLCLFFLNPYLCVSRSPSFPPMLMTSHGYNVVLLL